MTATYPLVHAAPTNGTKWLPCCDIPESYLADDEHGDTVTTDPNAVTCRPDTHHRNGERYSFTQAELWEMATERFGEDPRAWAFVCFTCGEISTPADFLAAGAEIGRCGQECIGKVAKTLTGNDPQGRPWASRGCNTVCYGLIPGPWKIIMPPDDDGNEVTPMHSFRLAPAPQSSRPDTTQP